MKDSNRLIAEFMNLNIVTLDDIRSNKNPMISSADGYTVDSLQYHTSWDWLMPVVAKISDLENQICEEPFELDEIKHSLLSDYITGVYDFVVEVITQYNNKQESMKDSKKVSMLDYRLRNLEKSLLRSWGLKNINGGFVDIEVVDYDDNVINVKITGGSADDIGSDITTRFGKLNTNTLEWIKQ
jgi:hypothetical protein